MLNLVLYNIKDWDPAVKTEANTMNWLFTDRGKDYQFSLNSNNALCFDLIE